MYFAMPIGTVVGLRTFERRVMIAGVRQVEVATGITWDYCGYFYPDGVVNSSEMILFNVGDIDSVYQLGFRDGEGLEFARILIETGEMPPPPPPRGGE